jgi:polyisoprenoid-binding protein YceI
MKSALLALALMLPFTAAHAQQDMTTDPAQVRPGTYVLDKAHGKITWTIDHLGFSDYMGQFADVNANLKLDPANPQNSTVDAVVNMDSLGTLNPKLDEHLRSDQFFDVKKFPTAKFVSTGVSISGDRTGTITGNLTLHGVTKPIVLTAAFNAAGMDPVSHEYKIGFTGSATIKRSDFGLNAYLPVLGDDVALDIEAEFVAPQAK